MRLLVMAVLLCGVAAPCHASPRNAPQPTLLSPDTKLHLQQVLRPAAASAVVLDWNTGAVLDATGKDSAAAPGSILKPLLLRYALQHGIVTANTEVYCRRTLRVGGRALPCAHPPDQPQFNAQSALAVSCNTWFAAMAHRMSAEDMNAALAQVGIHTTAPLNDADARTLTALGLHGVKTSRMQVALAYRALLLHEPHGSPVWNGLHDSVTFGMADNARIPGVEVMGKTGTASDPGEWWTHGWFAGGVPGRYVLVVYLPRGDGGTAATLAAVVIQQLLRESKP